MHSRAIQKAMSALPLLQILQSGSNFISPQSFDVLLHLHLLQRNFFGIIVLSPISFVVNKKAASDGKNSTFVFLYFKS